jgi:hypothetical protein
MADDGGRDGELSGDNEHIEGDTGSFSGDAVEMQSQGVDLELPEWWHDLSPRPEVLDEDPAVGCPTCIQMCVYWPVCELSDGCHIQGVAERLFGHAVDMQAQGVELTTHRRARPEVLDEDPVVHISAWI